jgi:hypothetical protein
MNFKTLHTEHTIKTDKELSDKEQAKIEYRDNFIKSIPTMFLAHLKDPVYTKSNDGSSLQDIKHTIIREGSVTLNELSFYFSNDYTEHPQELNRDDIYTSYDSIGSLPCYKKYCKVYFNENTDKIINDTVDLINLSNIGLIAMYDKHNSITIEVN